MNRIEVSDLVKIYGGAESKITALDGISFSLSFKELTVILGPSGSGKSTLLNILGGMDSATSGNVLIGDKNITKLREKELTAYRRGDIGFIFQFYNLMPNLTALENVQLCENGAGFGAFDAAKALELVGLSHRLKNFPGQLSGGEQQRVSIARAIVKKPKLLLCDEPTGALDTKTGRNVVILLQKIAKESDSAVIIVTHNANIAQAADRVIKMSDGKVVQDTVQASPLKAEEIEF